MLLLRFLNRQSFLTNQLTEHSSRQSGDYLPGLILVVNILLWSSTVFIITRHGLHGKPASYIYTGAVISSNSMGLQNSASRLAKPTSRSMMAESVLESSLPQEEGISTSKVYQHQRYQLAYYKATWCP